MLQLLSPGSLRRAVSARINFTSRQVNSAFTPRISATTPDTMGAAALVPQKNRVYSE